MARKKNTKSNKPKKPRSLNDLIGPPPVLIGESESTYEELFERVNDAVKPTDIFEEFAVQDLANAMMDSIRFARFKPGLLNANMHTGMERVLKPLCNLSVQIRMNMVPLDADKIAAGWPLREPSSMKIIEALTDGGLLSMDAVAAETLSARMDDFEAIDKLAMNNQLRRYTIQREIERYRGTKREASSTLRGRTAVFDKVKANDNEKSDAIIDVEYKEVDTDGSSEATKRPPKAAGE